MDRVDVYVATCGSETMPDLVEETQVVVRESNSTRFGICLRARKRTALWPSYSPTRMIDHPSLCRLPDRGASSVPPEIGRQGGYLRPSMESLPLVNPDGLAPQPVHSPTAF